MSEKLKGVVWYVDGKQVMEPCYMLWRNIVARCSKGYAPLSHEWNDYLKFKEWAEPRLREDYEIDKDLLGGHYSKNSCIFIPRALNLILMDKPKGLLPIGVSSVRKRFAARISRDGVRVYLGSSATKEGAHKLWQAAKIEVLEGFIGCDIFHDDLEKFQKGLESVIDRLRKDLSDGNVTTTLKGY